VSPLAPDPMRIALCCRPDMDAGTAAVLWALAASLCLALGPLFAVTPVRLIGPGAFSALRALVGSLVLAVIASAMVHRPGGTASAWALLAVSSLIGIYLADILVFHAVRAAGSRVAAILNAVHVPLTALFAVALNEVPTVVETLGIALCFGGLCVTILARNDGSVVGDDRKPQGFPAGLLAGIGAAVCQAVALVLVRLALNTGADPIAAATVRVALSAMLVNFFRCGARQDLCAPATVLAGHHLRHAGECPAGQRWRRLFHHVRDRPRESSRLRDGVVRPCTGHAGADHLRADRPAAHVARWPRRDRCRHRRRADPGRLNVFAFRFSSHARPANRSCLRLRSPSLS
jgi:drug/metabolite transporter (DMT)-like permease